MTQFGQESGALGAAAADAARLMCAAKTSALATLDRASGQPYASLVTIATDKDGAPLVLISGLARHTQNLDADPRSSLLFTPVGMPTGDPLAGARVTVMGRMVPTASKTARERFLANNPEAAMYASFADFRLFAMAVEHAHFIGGFGRIIDVPGSVLLAAACNMRV